MHLTKAPHRAVAAPTPLVRHNHLAMPIKLTTFLLIAILGMALILPASAQVLTGQAQTQLQTRNQEFLGEAGLSANLTLGQFVAAVIKVMLGFLGVIFIVLIIYSGITWMTSAGNEEKIGTAKKTMIAATIGLAIVLSAYAITFFIIDKLLEATRGGQGLNDFR